MQEITKGHFPLHRNVMPVLRKLTQILNLRYSCNLLFLAKNFLSVSQVLDLYVFQFTCLFLNLLIALSVLLR
jgi:hypothetical protein